MVKVAIGEARPAEDNFFSPDEQGPTDITEQELPTEPSDPPDPAPASSELP